MDTTEFNNDMAAVAFAEAGESGEARKMAGGTPTPKPAMARPKKKKPYMGALVFGAISLSAYVVLFKNERWVTTTFTMGGWNTIYPVGAAFFFSFIHGAFASNLLSVLGLEAKK